MNPAFRDSDDWKMIRAQRGLPTDLSTVNCPVAERVYADEVMSLGKDFLMSREQVDLILAAVRKIKDNLDELK